MKPKIGKNITGQWVLLCRRQIRAFLLFGASQEEREAMETNPLFFDSWEDAVETLRDLYHARRIIR